MSVALLAVVLASSAGAESAPSDPVFVRLERDGCFGHCPMYAIEITRAGVLRYDGRRFVQTTGPVEVGSPRPSSTRSALRSRTRASRTSIRSAATAWTYTDMPTVTVTRTEGGTSRTIRDYHGCLATPKRLRTLEEDIDRIVGIVSLIGPPPERPLRYP